MGFKRSSASILGSTLYKDLTLNTLIRPVDDEFIKEKLEKQRENDRLSSLLIHQKKFLEDKTTRHLGLVAGFGSGKSHAMCAKILQLSYDNPGCVGIAMEPTYGMLSDILIPQIQDLWDECWTNNTSHGDKSNIFQSQ